MFMRIIFFLIGFLFTLIGNLYLVFYFNLFTIGYNFFEYGKFIVSRLECLYTPIGLFLMALALYLPDRREKNELHL